MMNETVFLKYPITINGLQVDSVTMRRPTVGDLLDAERGGADDKTAEIRLMANLCQLAPDDIKLLDLYDYGKLQTQLGKFQSEQTPT